MRQRKKVWGFFVLFCFYFSLNEIIRSQGTLTLLWPILISKPAGAKLLQGQLLTGGWKWSQRGLCQTSRNFRGSGNLFLNAVCLRSHSPIPASHLALVTGDTVKGSEANCINQGSVLILSPMLVFCIKRVWLCQQHNVKDKTSKICKSFRCTRVFHLTYLRLWAAHYNFQRAPAKSSCWVSDQSGDPRNVSWWETGWTSSLMPHAAYQ